MSNTIEAWAIKTPGGRYIHLGYGLSGEDCIETYCGQHAWTGRLAAGYRCVRVRIEEVPA